MHADAPGHKPGGPCHGIARELRRAFGIGRGRDRESALDLRPNRPSRHRPLPDVRGMPAKSGDTFHHRIRGIEPTEPDFVG